MEDLIFKLQQNREYEKIFFHFFFLLVIATTTLFGQAYTSNIDSKLKFINSTLLKSGGLDNNNVPTGKLYDRVYPFAQLHEFNIRGSPSNIGTTIASY
jgi:hypothetical protein